MRTGSGPRTTGWETLPSIIVWRRRVSPQRVRNRTYCPWMITTLRSTATGRRTAGSPSHSSDSALKRSPSWTTEHRSSLRDAGTWNKPFYWWLKFLDSPDLVLAASFLKCSPVNTFLRTDSYHWPESPLQFVRNSDPQNFNWIPFTNRLWGKFIAFYQTSVIWHKAQINTNV
jgi:hypothetical protein